jgi:acyl carrier protein
VKTATIEKKTSDDIRAWMSNYLATQLSIAPAKVDISRRFDEYGIDSASAMQMVGSLEDYVGHKLSPSLPYQYPSIKLLSDVLPDLAHS